MAKKRTTDLYENYGKKMGRPVGTTGIKKTVLKQNKRVKCNFTISAEAAEYVEKKAASDSGISKSEVVDKAIIFYSNVNPLDGVDKKND